MADAIDLLPAKPQIKAGIGSEIVTQPVDRTSEEFLTFVYNTAHAYAAPDSPVFVAAVHVQGEGMTAFEALGIRAVYDLRTEAADEPPHANDRRFGWIYHQKSSCTNKMANRASARMTRKMDCTTATVVRRPSSRAESRTCMPR